MTAIETHAAFITLLRSQLAGEPLPQFDSPAADRITTVIGDLARQATERDLMTIGHAALQLLLEHWQAHMEAERAQLQARLSAMRSAGAGRPQ